MAGRLTKKIIAAGRKAAEAAKANKRGNRGDTPEKAEAARKGAAERVKARKAAEAQRTTQRSSSINKRTVSAEDIRQANTAEQFRQMRMRIDEMDEGLRKKSLERMLDAQEAEFDAMRSSEVDRASRKSTQAARDRKMKDKVTLPEAPFEYNKGGAVTGKPRKGHTDYRGKGLFK